MHARTPGFSFVALVGVAALGVALGGCGGGSANFEMNADGASGQASASAPPAQTQPPAPVPPPAPTATAAPADQNQIAVIEGDRIVVAKRILYDTDKDEIAAESYPVLDAVAHILKTHPEIKNLRVEGHTDNQGSVEYNLRLSERRANAVVGYLARVGVTTPMQAPGYGASVPVCFTDDEGCRQQNRRVEFKIDVQE